MVNPWLSARNAWWHNAWLRGFAGGVRPALRGAKAWGFADGGVQPGDGKMGGFFRGILTYSYFCIRYE